MNLPVLPVAASLSIEAGCILLFGVEMGLKAFYMSTRAFLASPWHLTQFILLVLNSTFVLVQARAFKFDADQARASSCALRFI